MAKNPNPQNDDSDPQGKAPKQDASGAQPVGPQPTPPQPKPPRNPEPDPTEDLLSGWDEERSVHELRDLEVSIAGTNLYIPSVTKTAMDKNWGSPVSTLATKTVAAEGKVSVRPCASKTPGARKIRASKTMGCGYVGFAIPLRKLGLTLPPGRRLTLPVQATHVKDNLWIYDIYFVGFENDPRKTGAAAQAKSKGARRKKAKEQPPEAS